MEIWNSVVGYEGRYKISNRGSIINLKAGQEVLGWQQNKYGYRKVRLCVNGLCKDYYVHQLVAKAFIPNPLGLKIINHIDCNPRNNRVENLEWCTQAENVRHAKECGRYSTKGKRIRNTITGEEFESIKKAADSCGMIPNTLVGNMLGRNNKKVPFEFF